MISYREIADRIALVLDGFVVNRTEQEDPLDDALRLYAPTFVGRLLYQDTLLGVRVPFEVDYITMDCLTDCCIATFKYQHIQALYEEDPAFARAVHESAIMLMYDFVSFIGILRAPSAYDKVRLCLDLLAENGLFISNNGVAQLLALDRTTVSREVAHLKQREPALWESYAKAKRHRVVMLEPDRSPLPSTR